MNLTHFSKADLQQLERIYRMNLINSVSGFKSANLIGTRSNTGQANLAVFNSVMHIGSNPAMQGFIMRPLTVERHTYENIAATGFYTINHIPVSHTAMAHYSSAKFQRTESEFSACDFTEIYLDDHPAPFVGESNIKMAMKLVQEIPIEANGTLLIIGSIEHLYVDEAVIDEDGALDLAKADIAALSGLNSYYQSQRIAKYPYARVGSPSKDLLNGQ
ncbi:MAG: flavin reductase [Bacteroidota bacterium]